MAWLAIVQNNHSRYSCMKYSDAYADIKIDMFTFPFIKHPCWCSTLLQRCSLSDYIFSMTAVPTGIQEA